jgi:acid phosphatase type 7
MNVFGQYKELTPNLLRGPYLQAATSSSMIIRWRTDASERGVVRYGTNKDSLNMRAENSGISMEHIVSLRDLHPATRYFYSVGGLTHTLQGDSANYFRTLPLPGSQDKYLIGAFGDCGNNSSNQKDIMNQFTKYLGNRYINAWLLLGDNAYESGTDTEYQRNFFEPFQEGLLKKYPLFPAPGNHDYRDIDKYRGKVQTGQQVAYFQNFTMPVKGEGGGVASENPAYYSFDIGNVHFLSLDSYGKEVNNRMYDTLGKQVQWIKKDLAANKNKGWVVAYWHHPPFTMGSHNSDKENELIKIRENLIQILERYGVDLVLTGHSHSYERSSLLKGHYGPEATFSSSKHNLSTSTGKYDGSKNSCPYIKDSGNKGTIYVVSGSAGKIDSRTQETYPHDAMVFSDATHGGALMLEVERNRLDLKWLGADGQIRDQFTMMKEVNRRSSYTIKKGQTIQLDASFVGDYEWKHSKETSSGINVTPPLGKHTYTVRDKQSCVQDTYHVTVTR